MSNKGRIIIKDSCILFDLIDLDLMGAFFGLGLEVHTTEYVISEVTDEDQLQEVNKYIVSGLLKVDNEGTYESIQEIFDQCGGLSFTDCSVLEFVIRTDGMVLSSDQTLRKEILKRKFNVRGLLWVIKELRDQRIITREMAVIKLNEYKQINGRAPKAEITRLIEILEKQ